MMLIQITPDELKTMIADAVQSAVSPHATHTANASKEPFIKGIHALGKYLGVSPVKAQQLKNSGAIPCFQDGRIVLFDPAKVREYMYRNH